MLHEVIAVLAGLGWLASIACAAAVGYARGVVRGMEPIMNVAGELKACLSEVRNRWTTRMYK